LSGLGLFTARLAVTLVLSMASYHLVEVPIRRRRLLGRGPSLALAAAMVGAVAVAGSWVAEHRTAQAAPSRNLHGVPADAALGAYGAPDQLDAIPTVRPGTEGVLIVGDSMAGSLGNGLTHTPWGRSLQDAFGITVANFGEAGCALSFGHMVLQGQDSAPSPLCAASGSGERWPQLWTKVVAAFDPSVSILATRLDLVDRIHDGTTVRIGQAAYDGELRRRLDLAVSILSARGGRVLFATSPYYRTGEQPDGSPWPEDAPWRVRAYNRILRQVAARHPGVVGIWDVGRRMSPGDRYAAAIDGVPVRYSDGIHWTNGADWLLFTRDLGFITHFGARSHAAT
jgi:hypothetical protein